MLLKQQLWDQALVICIHRNQHQNRLCFPLWASQRPYTKGNHKREEKTEMVTDRQSGVGWLGLLDGETAALGSSVIFTQS